MSLPTLPRTSSRRFHTLSTLDPLQQQIFQRQATGGGLESSPLYQQAISHLQNLLSGSPEATQAFEAPLMRQFQEQIIPGLAERFSGLGAGAQSSSAFQQALGSAGADLSERLAALRGGLQMQALPQALGFAQAPISNLQQLLGMQTQAHIPREQSFLRQLLLGLAPGAGQGLGGALTGGLSSLGSSLFGIGGLFGPRQRGSTINKFGQITGKF